MIRLGENSFRRTELNTNPKASKNPKRHSDHPWDGRVYLRQTDGQTKQMNLLRLPLLPPPPQRSEVLALKQESKISMMEQVRICAVWPTENWLGSS